MEDELYFRLFNQQDSMNFYDSIENNLLESQYFADHPYQPNRTYEFEGFFLQQSQVAVEGPLFLESESQEADELGMSESVDLVKLTKRVNNTIFKTSLSQYRKSIIDQIKTDYSQSWLLKQIRKIYRAKNQSIFPKLLAMVRLLNLNQAVKIRWEKRTQTLKHKKNQLLKGNKYDETRYAELLRTIDNMNLAINAENMEDSLKQYWGKYKQFNKYENAKRQVNKFQLYFKQIIVEKSSKIPPISPKQNKKRCQKPKKAPTRQEETTEDQFVNNKSDSLSK